MKIIFVDQSTDVQQKWIDPLRLEGWGVIRAQSAEDAAQMLIFHGMNLNYLVVRENDVRWAEKQLYPFLLMNESWSNQQISEHQASAKPAFAYLSSSSTVQDLKDALEKKPSAKKSGKIELESISEILSKPEATRSINALSIQLEAPNLLLGGEFSNHVGMVGDVQKAKDEIAPQPIEKTGPVKKPIVEEESFDSNEISIILEPAEFTLGGFTVNEVKEEIKEDVEAPQVQSVAESSDRTVVLDATRLRLESVQEPEVEAVDLESQEESELETLDLAVGSNYQSYDIPENVTPIRRVRSSDLQAPLPENLDLETMRNYLSLREQDVAMLTGQYRSAQERVFQLEVQLKVERAKSTELQHVVQKQDQEIKNHELDKQVESEVLFKQVEDLNHQLQERTEKARIIETKLRLTTLEVDKIKERVRVDIRRIRVREKELESQLEIIKKDSSALLLARDEKIVELKRKIDLLEFNMELVQEQFQKERLTSDQLRTRLKDAASAMRQAGGLLDHEN